MIIFIKNIPFETQRYEIARFIGRIFHDCFIEKPTAKISLEDIKILSIQDVGSNTIE